MTRGLETRHPPPWICKFRSYLLPSCLINLVFSTWKSDVHPNKLKTNALLPSRHSNPPLTHPSGWCRRGTKFDPLCLSRYPGRPGAWPATHPPGRRRGTRLDPSIHEQDLETYRPPPQSRSYLVPSDLIHRTSRYRPQDLPFAFVLDTSCPGKSSTNPWVAIWQTQPQVEKMFSLSRRLTLRPPTWTTSKNQAWSIALWHVPRLDIQGLKIKSSCALIATILINRVFSILGLHIFASLEYEAHYHINRLNNKHSSRPLTLHPPAWMTPRYQTRFIASWHPRVIASREPWRPSVLINLDRWIHPDFSARSPSAPSVFVWYLARVRGPPPYSQIEQSVKYRSLDTSQSGDAGKGEERKQELVEAPRQQAF